MRPIRQATINISAGLLLATSFPLLVWGSWSLHDCIDKANLAAAQEMNVHLLGDQMKEASDFLTDQVRSFVVTRQKDNLYLYWEEVESVRRRDEAVRKSLGLGASPEEIPLLVKAKNESDRLIVTEARAMRLVADAIGLPVGELPLPVAACSLSDAEEALGPAAKIHAAETLVFGNEYLAAKRKIMGAVSEFRLSTQLRASRVTLDAQAAADKAFYLMIAICALALAGGIFLVLFYYAEISVPIKRYMTSLAVPLPEEGTSMPALLPCGTRELWSLAEAFNRRRAERLLFERALRDSELRHSTTLRMMPLAGMEIDEHSRLTSWNPAAAAMFGHSESEALGRDVVELLVPEGARAEIGELIDKLREGDRLNTHTNRNVTKDGREITCEWYNTPLFDSSGTWTGWASIVKDITRQQEENEKVLWLSRHDPLTELCTRRFLLEKFEDERQRCRRTKSLYSAVMLDIDGFKGFNDRHGHECGDVVLRTIAAALKSSVRATDSVGRWGGEEFLILLPETPRQGGIELAEKIRRHVEETAVPYGGTSFSVTVTVGIAGCREDDESVDDCIRRSDEALLAGKAQGRNVVVAAT